MADIRARAALRSALSTTAIAAIVTGIGVVLLCLLIALVLLLIRAVRTHKQLLADLEERGLTIAQVQRNSRTEVVSRPKTVLRRNTILPFNKSSGWGALPSVETFRSVETSTVPAHYVPAKPTEEVKRTSRLSWPFSARRLSGHTVQMRRMKASRLSTVMEDTKPSPLVPVLSSSHLNGSRPSIAMPREPGSRPSSSQSLLQHHPAFRPEGSSLSFFQPETRPVTGPFIHSAANTRLQRAKSVAETPSAHITRPQLRARSASLCNQTSGTVPDVILPPLPLDIARIKSGVKRRSQLRQAPSKLSSSSIGSVDTTILASRTSPAVPSSTKFRGQKITKPNAKGSSIGGPRPFRDTLDLRARVLSARSSMQSNMTRVSVASSKQQDVQSDSKATLSADSSTLSLGTVTRAQSVTLSKVSSPTGSPITVRSLTTPKRKLKTQVSSSGSPERPSRGSTNTRGLAGPIRSPKRQHSQTSSRSSGGNPFQWDSAPLSSTGKPSALKGSPSARKGHRRGNSVRISLIPTFHGPPSRTPSPSLLNSRPESFADIASSERSRASISVGFSGTRSLPTPPSSSTFAPDLKFTATSLQASLTPTSPTLPLVNYDQTYVVFPTDQVLPQLSEVERNRLSTGSVFSLSRFPTTPSIIEPMDTSTRRPLTFPSSQPYDGFQLPGTPLLYQHPFPLQTPQHSRSSSETSLINIDEYDPERPSCIYQTPVNTASRTFQSAFAAIPEESSASSKTTREIEYGRYEDSPPLSPKSCPPPRFDLEDRSAYNLPVHATSIPEEPLDTIDPAILSRDNFNLLTSSFTNLPGTSSPPMSSPSSMPIPRTPGSAHSLLLPLLEAAFPSSPPRGCGSDSPTMGYVGAETEGSSMYSSPTMSMSPSPSLSPIEMPSPVFPCSPRPSHASLPAQSLSINFAQLPHLQPSPRGPRLSPSRPLRSSIVALRRMNSDAADAKKTRSGKGERRYLRLGREDSVQLPGEESWLDEMEESGGEELDEEVCRVLVGSVLEGWEGEGEGDDGVTGKALSPTVSVVEKETVEKPTIAASSPSIWEDGEKFWTNSLPTTTTTPLRRTFTVATDQPPSYTPSPTSLSPTENFPTTTSPVDKRRSSRSSQRYRKRSVLGVVGTPNVKVRIQVTGADGVVVDGGMGGGGHRGVGGTGRGGIGGSPGLYDAQGFLRF